MPREADFIIVGAGTAGSAAAEALTRDGRTRVLLLEAGGPPASPFVGIPAGFAKLFRGKLDWGFSSEPDPRSGRSVFIPRGRMLGGSANLNAQIHQWGRPDDFDAWAQAGCTGWGYSDIAPVLRDLEAFAGNVPERGGAGPLAARTLDAPHPLSRAFQTAAGLDGQPASYNGAAPEGAWISEVTQRNGRRFSTWDGLLKPAMKRANLDVVTNALATAIIMTSGRATGVRILRHGRAETLAARRGVLVCAGAFGSPHLLMLSGIGPAAHLRAHGIDIVHDAPGVGENLHDHPMACPTFATRRRDTLKSAESPANLFRYIFGRTGALASNVAEAIAFRRSSPALASPDIELLFAPVEWREEGLAPPRHHAFTIAAILLRPRSRGRVTLRDGEAQSAPRIDLGLLSDTAGADRQDMIAAIQLARSIAARAPLSATMTAEIAPGRTDVSAWLDREIQTVYHPGGSCRMGADAGAVVTPRLSVKGVDGLWVADASVMPRMVSGHPNLSVAMIGRRAAEFVQAP
jgi:choline dehydrogenase